MTARPDQPHLRAEDAMSEPVTLGLDLGTSGVKVVALTATGEAVAAATRTYPLLTPRPGWTEQDPAAWVAASVTALREVAGTLRGGGHAPVALGLSGQMHGLVALGAGGEVLRPAPLWNDQRTGAAVAELEAAIPRRELIARTGNRAVTGFQLPKLLWLRAAEPETFRRLRHALLPKDYLGYVLTGELRTEPSDASGVGALNLERGEWDGDLLAALDLSPTLFPEVGPSWARVGGLRADLAAATGLPLGLPVVAGAGDNAAAGVALGLRSARPEVGGLSLGTSGVLFAPVPAPTPEPEGRVHLFAHADGGYVLLGVTLACAGAVQWFRDALAPGTRFETLLDEAAGVPDGADGVTFLPYLAGERSPLMDPDLRGAWLGLSLAHGRPHLLRAVLEATACALADTADVLRPHCGVTRWRATGGGARSDLWLGVVGGALGQTVARPAAEPGAAEGAALLAMPEAGFFPDLAAVMDAHSPTDTPVPALSAERARHQHAEALARVYPDHGRRDGPPAQP